MRSQCLQIAVNTCQRRFQFVRCVLGQIVLDTHLLLFGHTYFLPVIFDGTVHIPPHSPRVEKQRGCEQQKYNHGKNDISSIGNVPIRLLSRIGYGRTDDLARLRKICCRIKIPFSVCLACAADVEPVPLLQCLLNLMSLQMVGHRVRVFLGIHQHHSVGIDNSHAHARQLFFVLAFAIGLIYCEYHHVRQEQRADCEDAGGRGT